MTRPTDKLWQLLSSRAHEIITAEGLRRRLAVRRRLRVKLGIDPTAPDLHLGHAVPLRMLRAFQDAGHRVVLIIGDFTARIGDPAGQTTGRRQLSSAEVKRNERTYLRQAGQILTPATVEVRHNSEWHARAGLGDFLGLLTHFPLRTATQRDDFQRRLRAGQEVRLHEAMYPVLQAYDSVMVKADVELGGLDQRLNLLAGRELQRALGQPPQEVVVFPYLIGLDGKLKMSKSAGNTVNLSDSAPDMFGKVMSIPDALIVNYAELAAWLPPEAVRALRRRLERRENPRDVKRDVAEAIVRLYRGPTAARRAREEFLRIFSERKLPATIPVVSLAPGEYRPVELLVRLKAAASKSQARRLIAGRALSVGGAVVAVEDRRLTIRRGSMIRVGKKRFCRVR